MNDERNFRNLTPEQEDRRRHNISVAKIMHGHRIAPKGSPEYRTWVAWCSMRQRCYDTNRPDFSRYGGRGISVCAEWAEYSQFLLDLGLVPSGYSLDRIDNASNYEPGNCRWASKQEQARNRRSNKRLLIGGVERTLAEWAELSGLQSSTIRMRIKYNGGKVDDTILRPVSC
jgi:hypothetical protein